MGYPAKDNANEKLARITKDYKEATLVWQLAATSDNWDAKEKLRKALDRAKTDARKYWSPGDPPII